MVSAHYIVRPGRCALGDETPEEELARKDRGEEPAPQELYVLELHRGEPPRLRRTQTADEIGICLEHWGQAVQAIGDLILGLIEEEDPAAAAELRRRRGDYIAQEVEDALETPEATAALQAPEKPHRVPRKRRSYPMT